MPENLFHCPSVDARCRISVDRSVQLLYAGWQNEPKMTQQYQRRYSNPLALA
jgi:hypothetical protein